MSTLIKPPSPTKMAVRTAIILFIFVIAFTGLLSGAYLWTRPTILAAESAEKMALIDAVLPRELYDNKLLEDRREIAANPALGLDEATTAFIARKNGKAQAIVLEALAPDGYAGKIRLLIAIGEDGRLYGVRVTQHKETPGLGDYIEPKKDRNKEKPWITQFNGLAAATIDAREWKVKKDGGRFDSVAGATVTPRAVIKAVRKAALFVAENRATLFGSQ